MEMGSYTGIRVRGSDATRCECNNQRNSIIMTLKVMERIGYMPDFASSIEFLQLQRGVGTSTNGSGAFGAKPKLITDSC
jgi:iron complex outermembrane receptor protein